ncbi:hypothetical protein Tco_0117571 [Tanacetum coccineum]
MKEQKSTIVKVLRPGHQSSRIPSLMIAPIMKSAGTSKMIMSGNKFQATNVQGYIIDKAKQGESLHQYLSVEIYHKLDSNDHEHLQNEYEAIFTEQMQVSLDLDLYHTNGVRFVTNCPTVRDISTLTNFDQDLDGIFLNNMTPSANEVLINGA